MSPRFNHVAMSVPASMLDDAGRADLVRFYNQVFGFTEMDYMTKPGEQLVLQAYAYDQFVFVIADENPMQAPQFDHFGMAVDMDEYDDFLERARAFAAEDDRATVIGPEIQEFGDFLTLHNFYVGFTLPMMIEVQCYEWADGIDPTKV